MSIESSYNSWAAQYDSQDNKTRDLDHIATCETLSQYSYNKVLELGCGTGKNTRWLLTKAKRIIGLDFSDNMLNVAREKISDERAVFAKADLNKDWPVEDQYADLITCSLTLEHIEDLNHIFSQSHQKLRKEGLFFVSELHPFRQYLGSKAKFETQTGLHELEVYMHHISEYTNTAKLNGFQLVELKEWFDQVQHDPIPRLISFIFHKKPEV